MFENQSLQKKFNNLLWKSFYLAINKYDVARWM